MFKMPSGTTGTVRYQGKTWRQAGRIVDFFIKIQHQDRDGAWRDYYEIDCNHGHAHAHRYVGGKRDGKTPETLLVLDSVSDVTKALRLALLRINEEREKLEARITEEGI